MAKRAAAQEAAVDIDGLVVRFAAGRGRTVEAIAGLNLRVERGCVFGFLGPNGAGKTTTIQALLGFVPPDAGTVRLLGEDVRRSVARQRVGYLPETPFFYPFLSGRELLEACARLFGLPRAEGRRRAEALLRRVGLADAADRRVGTYSRGMLQRAGLAQALVNDPDLVILDEPTSGMDPLGRMDVRGLIAELRGQGKTIFFSSHELSEVELVCDRVAVLVGGRVAAEGPPATLGAGEGSLESHFLDIVRRARAEGGAA